MSSIIRGSTLEKTRWKNGRGYTREIVRSPFGPDDNNGESASDYDWRLSFADIEDDSPFSEFPGYDRLLVVWKGPGLILGETLLRPLEPFAFSGDRSQEARLLVEPPNTVKRSPVRDLGLIFKRGRIEARFEIAKEGRSDANFLFVTAGELTVDGVSIRETDTIVEPRLLERLEGQAIAIYLRTNV